MTKTSPADAGAHLADVRCPVLIVEGSADPEWADPGAEGLRIINDLTDGLTDLTHRIAVLAATELGDGLRDAMQGRAGGDALAVAAQTLRRYVKKHPGRYAVTIGIRPTDAEDLLAAARERTLGSFAAVLRGYRLEPADEIYALRMLRSVLHGFATLEASDGFQLGTGVDDSFSWVVDFIDRGLRVAGTR